MCVQCACVFVVRFYVCDRVWLLGDVGPATGARVDALRLSTWSVSGRRFCEMNVVCFSSMCVSVVWPTLCVGQGLEPREGFSACLER